MRLSAPKTVEVQRIFWDFSHANWDSIREGLRNANWDSVVGFDFFGNAALSSVEIDTMVVHVTEFFRSLLQLYVPQRQSVHRKSTHPWLDDSCRRAIRSKLGASGTVNYAKERDRCTETLRCAFNNYICRTRDKLCSFRRSPKEWWKLSNSLLMKSVKASSIPPLKDANGGWVRDKVAKANLLAETFLRKSELPELRANQYTPDQFDLSLLHGDFIDADPDNVLPILSRVREDSGTGSDGIPARFLKRCRNELAVPFAKIVTHILTSSRWPKSRRLHLIHAIFKKKSRADPSNYRGVHITSQVSKVVERVILQLLRPFLRKDDHQFSYSPGRGHRDVLLCNIKLAVCS